MFKFKKPIITILVLLVLGGAGVVLSQRKPPVVEESPPSEVRGITEEAVTADLVLDFGPNHVGFGASEEKIATYSGVKTTEKTVLGLLRQAATDHDFEVDYNPPSGEMGAFIKSIAGRENTDESFWQFWVNSEYGQVAMDRQEIKDGDLVEIKFRGFEQ